MATGKHYYWIKLRESFMNSEIMDFLMSQKNGADYVILYQMLCLKTVNTGGRLAITVGEYLVPYDVEKIQRDCKWFPAGIIRAALDLYKGLGLIYEDTDGILVISELENMVGSETDWSEKKRKQRSERAVSGDNVPTPVPSGIPNSTSAITQQFEDASGDKSGDIVPIENKSNRDIEIRDIETRDIETRDTGMCADKPHTRAHFRPPALEEVASYCQERNNGINVQKWYDHYTANGWMVGRSKMKDWKAAVRTWEHNEYGRSESNAKGRGHPYGEDKPRATSDGEEIW